MKELQIPKYHVLQLALGFWAYSSLNLFQRPVGSSQEVHLVPEHQRPSHLGFIVSCAAVWKEADQDWYGYSTKSIGTKGLPSFYITNLTAQWSSSKPPQGPRWLLAFQLSCLNFRQQDKPYPTYLTLSHWPNFSHMATCSCKGRGEIWCFPLRHTAWGSVTKTQSEMNILGKPTSNHCCIPIYPTTIS